MSTERRTLPTTEIEIREADGKPQTIAGYGARYYDGTKGTEYTLWDDSMGRAVERILPGAFDRAVKEDDVRGMYNHKQILGRTSSGTMRLTLDSRGLSYEIDVPDTQVGKDVATHVKRGDVTGSSFMFRIPPGGQKWTRTEDEDGKEFEVREISEVELFDTGPVDFPAYESTTAGVRAVADVSEARSAFQKHRDATKESDKAAMDKVKTRARVVEISALSS